MVAPLPPELTDYIIDYLHRDVASLGACALTCSSWLPAARYHRFRLLRMSTNARITAFGELVASSPAIGLIVYGLRIHRPTLECLLSILPSLPSLVGLEVSNGQFTQGNFKCRRIDTKFPALRRLEFNACILRLDILANLLMFFPRLLDLRMLQPHIHPISGDAAHPVVGRRLKRLRTVMVDHDPISRNEEPHRLYSWLIDNFGPNRLVRFRINRKRDDPSPLQPVLDVFGPHRLRDILLGLYNLEDKASQTLFTLKPCVNLRVITIKFGTLEPPAPTVDLTWISVLISQLNSPFLETIDLSISVLPCNASLNDWRFDSIRALDWENINQTLQRPILNNLREFKICGRGPVGPFKAFLEEKCPAAYKRGLFQLKPSHD
ncbi:uncharacterized protein C8Q71DRAFT_861599 [Rhodofomes roseus]|uniref:F-box domain-containing protein n=1 Tax=Rhodofomes roseus TaxID=34475 RepID=A0ABQ8K3X5_9APHY|nr:uncharacterized protein C8Q71DRAFT_861599 [Rhodofomes roseus]KAH9831579.1 hypothetical protein C8Q71DRAFT_861599 [Rhodofomes roseus]